MKLSAGHMNQGMVKIHDVFKVDDKAAVCLEKAVFWQQFQPVLHIVNGVKIAYGGMDDNLSPESLYHDDGRCRKRVYALFCFNRDFNGYGIIQADSFFHISEKTVKVQWL